jgi:hypothetical protein
MTRLFLRTTKISGGNESTLYRTLLMTMSETPMPPSTRRRGGRGGAGAHSAAVVDGNSGSDDDLAAAVGATATSRRWRGNNNHPHLRRSLVVRLIAIVSISVLATIAIDLSGFKNADKSSSINFGRGGGGDDGSSSSSSSSSSSHQPPQSAAASKDTSATSTRNRIDSEIKSLEKELRILSAEYRAVSKEIAQIVDTGDRSTVDDNDTSGLEPDVVIFDGIEDVARKGMLITSDKDVTREKTNNVLQKEVMASQSKVEKRGDLRRKKKKMEEEEEEEEENVTTTYKVTPKKYWIRTNLSVTEDRTTNKLNDIDPSISRTGSGGAIIPIDLSVNHLQRIIRVPGSPSNNNRSHDNKNSPVVIDEEFLPVVQSHEIDFRWRSRARPHAEPGDAVKTSAYRIEARRAQYSASLDGNDTLDDDEGGEGVEAEVEGFSSKLLWDSGKVPVSEGLPDVVHCSDSQLTSKGIIGSIIEWRVTIWDSRQPQPLSSTSGWTKFAVGPTQQNDFAHYDDDGIDGDDEADVNDNDDENDDSGWKARWISHPIDIESWDKTDGKAFWGKIEEHRETACRNWEKRSQLPIFRAKLKLPSSSSSINLVAEKGGNTHEDDEIASALLVVSGLGSFRASFDGVPLSSSGPLDPPFTDFSQRVSYRGFDVTKFLTKSDDKDIGEGEHIVGISMGSGECELAVVRV